MHVKPRYISTFDSLRAVAVLMVLITHTGILLHLPFPQAVLNEQWIIRWGHLGVNLFFVLSGFLITRILIADRGQPHAYRNFLIRRSLRIFPIYYLVILLLLILRPGAYLAWASIYATNYRDAISEQVHPMSHAWSLSVEEHFYLLWSPIVLFLSLRVSRACARVIFPLVSVASVLLTLMYAPGGALGLIYRGTNYQIVALATGCVLAYHERWLAARARNTLAACAALLIASVLTGSLLAYALRAPMIVTRLYSYTLLSASLLCAWLWVDLYGGQALRSMLTAKPLTYLGKISYGIYLYHFPVLLAFDLFPPGRSSPMGIVGLVFAITLLIAAASYHLIERPILSMKSRFTSAPAPT